MTHNIKITPVTNSRLTEVDFKKIPFGQTFSDHLFSADYHDGVWQNFQIIPFGYIPMHPANLAIHYGQSIFEGMKASKMQDGTPALLRPELHIQRLNESAERMCMPAFPESVFLEALELLVDMDKGWIPEDEGSALYIRPVMFACDETIGVRPSDTYKLLIMTGPVGPYYPKPVRLWAEEHYIRAAQGGVGEAKTAGNYAASLLAAKEASAKGYDQILWLDAKEYKYVQEAGTMNLAFVIDGKMITPNLSGTILKGITRRTAIEMLTEKGYTIEERPITIDEVVAAYHAGTLQEAFGLGTAAVVSHVSEITYRDLTMVLPSVENRPMANLIKDFFNGLRSGRIEDIHGWVVPVRHLELV